MTCHQLSRHWFIGTCEQNCPWTSAALDPRALIVCVRLACSDEGSREPHEGTLSDCFSNETMKSVLIGQSVTRVKLCDARFISGSVD